MTEPKQQGPGWTLSRPDGKTSWHGSEAAGKIAARTYRAKNPDDGVRFLLSGPQGQTIKSYMSSSEIGRGKGNRLEWREL